MYIDVRIMIRKCISILIKARMKENSEVKRANIDITINQLKDISKCLYDMDN